MSEDISGAPGREGGFMLAAETAITQLQKDSAALRAEVKQAKKEARWRKLQVRILGAVSAMLIVLGTLGTFQFFHVNDLAHRIQQGSIAQCEGSNVIRHSEVQVWDSFIDLLLKGNTNPVAASEGAMFKQQLAQTLSPRNCNATFGANAANPSSLPPNVSTTANEPEIVQLKNWNGQCLTVVNANTGTRVTVVACSKAHDWWYYPEASNGGTFRPEGHASVGIGDSGGFAALVPVSSYGSEIHTDGGKSGPGGYIYQRLYIAPLGSHGRLHANGTNGATVSIQTPVSNADFYALLGNINSNAVTATD